MAWISNHQVPRYRAQKLSLLMKQPGRVVICCRGCLKSSKSGHLFANVRGADWWGFSGSRNSLTEGQLQRPISVSGQKMDLLLKMSGVLLILKLSNGLPM